jgi:hypothetical protein
MLMLETNAKVIQASKEELLKTPLANWIELLEKVASTIHLSDSGSVRDAMNEFVQTYGSIPKHFSESMFELGSPLGLIIHEARNKPNNK